MTINEIPESEIFMLHELGEFKIKLYNQKSKTEIIVYEEWLRNYGQYV